MDISILSESTKYFPQDTGFAERGDNTVLGETVTQAK